MGDKTPTPRLWASPRNLMGSGGRSGIRSVIIRQVNLPYHTNNKCIPSISIDNLTSLVGKKP